MSNITVKFIGKEYSIPKDVITYIDLLDFADNVQKQLMADFISIIKGRIQNKNVGLIDDEDLRAQIEKQVGRFIAKLCDQGIFTRTVNDYLNDNKGYEYFSKVNKAALEKVKSFLMQRLDSLQEGYEDAFQKAESHITGMGFSIWSSSFVNHAIYAAMQASTINKQEKEASVAYQREINELCTKLESDYDRETSQYINNEYIPNMEAAFTVLAYELLDLYVVDLIESGKFNKTALYFVNIGRSNDLLKNLTLSNNKQAILENAFAACPYNVAVYMQAMKYDLLNYDSFQTANFFRLGSTIISFLEENLGSSPKSEKRQLNFKNAELLSLYSGRSLREITAYVADFIVDGYAQTIAALSDTEPCYSVMNKVEERAILAGDSISKQKAAWLVDPLAPTVLWDKLTCEYGHTDLFDRLLNLLPDRLELNNKQEYDTFLKNRLFSILETIRQERVEKIHEQQREEARKKEEEAERAKRRAKRNKKIGIICLIAVAVAIIIAIISSVITKANNAKAYQNMAGEFCVYRVINDDGEERDEFNWWLSIDEDGTMKMSSWSYAFDNTTVDSYSGELKNKADFRKFEDYRIEDYCADVSEYEEALYCYEFHIADEWDEFDGYIVCWQYHNGKIVDVYCDDYRYSFVETSDDYSFNEWESEINSDELSINVQKLINNINVSEEDIIEGIEAHISADEYDDAVALIAASKLSDEQKNAYYESLLNNIDFNSFDVNGLVLHIPEQWNIREKDNINILDAVSSNDGAYACFWVEYEGASEEVENYGKQDWITRNKLSKTTIPGCTSAYVRYETHDHGKHENYYVIEHYVECDGQIFQLQYLAYGDRYFEEEVWMLLDRVEFTNYAENRADIQEQKYLDAIELFDEGKYEEALSIFAILEGYKESEQKITECNNAITDGKYNSAIALINEGKYKDALVLLDEVGDYKDATDLKQKYALLACETGDVITFGAYEQDNILDNGAEAIEWVVLERDGNKSLVISRYCIEWLPFHDTITEVSWRNSSIRSWLNNTFLNGAFTAQEKKSIISTQHTNPDFYDDSEGERNWLGTTTDTVFLLSSGEADKYFSSDSARQAEGTEYACNKGKSASWYWWLRSANNIEYAGFVSKGELGYGEEVDRNMGIRPAMWIEISE